MRNVTTLLKKVRRLAQAMNPKAFCGCGKARENASRWDFSELELEEKLRLRALLVSATDQKERVCPHCGVSSPDFNIDRLDQAEQREFDQLFRRGTYGPPN